MSRFMERAENIARILGVTSNVVLCSTPETQEQNLLAPLTITASTESLFRAARQRIAAHAHRFHGARREESVEHLHLHQVARDNAHAVRWQITSEMWETLNATWIEMRSFKRAHVDRAGGDALLRLGERALASVSRRHVRHHHARRSVQLFAPRHVPRARRRYRAHPRREIPHPAAARGGRGRRARLLPVGRFAAVGVELRDLSHASTATRSGRSTSRSS